MPGISEKPVSPDTLLSIKKCARSAGKVLGIEPRSSTPSIIAATIDEFVCQWQQGIRPDHSVMSGEDAPLLVGSLWGEALVSRFKWQWAIVNFHDDTDVVVPAVVSPDRSLAIYPLDFLLRCFNDQNVDPAIMRSYNMLKSGAMDELQLNPRTYFNVMEEAHRALP